MPSRARLFRWTISIIGLGALLLVIPFIRIADPTDIAALVLVILAAELALTIRLDAHRALSFGSTFTFIIFLVFGAALAALVQVVAWLASQLLQRLRATPRPTWTFTLFNAGQLALCGLIGGGAVWLIFGTPITQPPASRLPALAVYALTYLVTNVLLTSIATWLRFGAREVRAGLWPNVSFYTLLSFVISVALALFVISIASTVSFIWNVLLTFSFLAVLSYIVRINLRFRETNRELSVLNEISRNLAESLDLADLFPAIYDSVRQVMPVDLFLIGLVNADYTEMEVPFLIENGELLAPRTVPLEGSMSERVLRTGKPALIPTLGLEADQIRFGRTDRPVAAITLVPLCLGDRSIGVISAQSYTPESYTLHQLGLLESIGRSAAVAINNARLFGREKEVLRSREEFVSLVAHELKNPLAALMGHTQLLERRVRQSDEKIRRTVGIIREQGERMNRLVEDLLDLSRADTGRLALHPQRVDLHALVTHVVDQQRSLSRNHRFVVEDLARLPVVDGDVLRLTQVLQNLLNNAIKYSPNGGTITVRLNTRESGDPGWPRRVRKIVEHTACWVVVQISDQGVGIPPDQLGRIFERFYRANNIAQSDISGTGLGLSVCEGLVRAHGGVIWATSEWGMGSTFTFALPVSPSELGDACSAPPINQDQPSVSAINADLTPTRVRSD